MNNMILRALLEVTLSGTLLALVVFVVNQVLKTKVSRKFQYYIWLVILIHLLTPFKGSFGLVNFTVPVPAQQARAYTETANTDLLDETENPTPVDTIQPLVEAEIETRQVAITETIPSVWPMPAKPYTGVSSILLWAWLGIGGLLLSIKTWGYWRYTKALRKGRRLVTDPAALTLYHRLARQLKIKRPPLLAITEFVQSPMLVGGFKPVIFLPEILLHTQGLEYILAHELIHYKRGDFFYKWLVNITACVHWFNPIVYLMARDINKKCELSCDEAVLEKISDGNYLQYGQTLLSALAACVNENHHSQAPVVALAEDGKLLQERLISIKAYKGRAKAAAALSVLLLALAALAACTTGITIVEEPAYIYNPGATMTLVPISNPYNPGDEEEVNFTWYPSQEHQDGKKQLDEKIQWLEDIYPTLREPYALYESAGEEEIYDTAGIAYLFDNSPAYKAMASRPLIDTFPRMMQRVSYQGGQRREYSRQTFYVSQPADLYLTFHHQINNGSCEVQVVSPDGERVYLSENDWDEAFIPVTTGLWQIITAYDIAYDHYSLGGEIRIDATLIKETERIPVDIDALLPGDTIRYGPLNAGYGDLVVLQAEREENGVWLDTVVGQVHQETESYRNAIFGSSIGSIEQAQLFTDKQESYEPYSAYVILTHGNLKDNPPEPITGIKGEIIIYSESTPK